MRKLIYTIAFTLAGLVGMAQTNQPLPSGAIPFGATTYLSPLDSTIWLYKERDGVAIKVANWVDVDSLFKLGYTKAQVDTKLGAKLDTSAHGFGLSWNPTTQNMELDDQFRAPYSNSAQSNYMAYDVSKNGIWNQWTEPISVIYDGYLWFSSTGKNGEVYISRRSTDGNILRKKITTIDPLGGGWTGDDHSTAAILIDDRPGADFPIMVFQTNHNNSIAKYWRFPDSDLPAWNVNTFSTIPGSGGSYVQAFRYGDEIFLFGRNGSPNFDSWSIRYSDDNGDTWVNKTIFTAPAGDLYLLAKEKDDGSGLNIVFNGHPINSSDQGIYFMELLYSTGELINPQDRDNPVIDDIREAIADPLFEPVDPFTTGYVVYSASGGEATRLWDVSRSFNGGVTVLFTVIPSTTPSQLNFYNTTYNVTRFLLSNGNVVPGFDGAVIEQAGAPIENPKGANYYFAGAVLTGKTTAVVARWRTPALSHGSPPVDDFEIDFDYGHSDLINIDFFSGVNPPNVVKSTIMSSDRKLIRPLFPKGGNTVIVNEAKYYQSYLDFNSDVIIHNFNEQ